MITTDDPELARRMRVFRNHGITTDHRQREQQGSWFYEMVDLGYNYRLSDIQCALGISQLRKLPGWVARRREIAQCYDTAFAELPFIQPLAVRPEVGHAYHLYMVRIRSQEVGLSRAQVFTALRANGIGVNVHYIPVHLHPYYRRRFGTGPGLCPVAETVYWQLITLPIFPAMRDDDVQTVIGGVSNVLGARPLR